jgi:hypothetical protein
MSIWSADGSKVAFPASDGDGGRRYWVDLEPLPDSWAMLKRGSFSPSGSRFAYTALKRDEAWYMVADNEARHPHYSTAWQPFWISRRHAAAVIEHLGPNCENLFYYVVGASKAFGPFSEFREGAYYTHAGPQLMVLFRGEKKDSLFLNAELFAKAAHIQWFTIDPQGTPVYAFSADAKSWYISHDARRYGPFDDTMGVHTDIRSGFQCIVKDGQDYYILSIEGRRGPYSEVVNWLPTRSGRGAPILVTLRSDGTYYVCHGQQRYGPYDDVGTSELGLSEDGSHCWYAAKKVDDRLYHAYLDGKPIGPGVPAIRQEMVYSKRDRTLAWVGRRKRGWSVWFKGSWLGGEYPEVQIHTAIDSEDAFVALAAEPAGDSDQSYDKSYHVLTATSSYGPYDNVVPWFPVDDSGTSWVAAIRDNTGWRVLLNGTPSPVLKVYSGRAGGPVWNEQGRVMVMGSSTDGSLVRLIGTPYDTRADEGAGANQSQGDR